MAEEKQDEGIDFNQQLLDMNDKPLVTKGEDEEDEDVRLGNLCCNALMSSMQDDKADGVQKLKRFNLARKIKGKSTDEEFCTFKLKDREEKMILELAEKAFPTLFYARVHEAIKGNTEDDDE